MLTFLEKDVLFERWIDHQDDLITLCNQFASKYGEDPEDTLDLGISCFYEAHMRYSPEKGEYLSWMKGRVWLNLLDGLRKKQYRNATLKRSGIDLTLLGRQELQFDREGLENILSKDAKLVLSLVLDCPPEILNAIASGNGSDGTWRKTIINHLKSTHKWKMPRVSEAFEEIKEAIS